MSGYRRLAAQRRNSYATGGAAKPFDDMESDAMGGESDSVGIEGGKARKRNDRSPRKTQINIIVNGGAGEPPVPVGAPAGLPPAPPIIPPPPMLPPGMVPPGAGGPPPGAGMPLPPGMNTGGRVGFNKGGRVRSESTSFERDRRANEASAHADEDAIWKARESADKKYRGNIDKMNSEYGEQRQPGWAYKRGGKVKGC